MTPYYLYNPKGERVLVQIESNEHLKDLLSNGWSEKEISPKDVLDEKNSICESQAISFLESMGYTVDKPVKVVEESSESNKDSLELLNDYKSDQNSLNEEELRLVLDDQFGFKPRGRQTFLSLRKKLDEILSN